MNAKLKKRHTKKVERFEVSCVRCGFTKHWTQNQWQRHMQTVHGMTTDAKVGADPRPEEQRQLFPISPQFSTP